MCGRFALGIPRNQIQQLEGYNLDIGEWVDEDVFIPRHNIAPRTYAPVIRRNKQRANTLHSMKFGLVPSWSKHEDPKLNTINARSENLVEGGGMWDSMKRRKRCIVVAQGYFEWLKKDKERLPHFLKREDGKLMLFAGLYDHANLEGVDKPIWSFSIVTTAASSEFAWLHDRQPVILSSEDEINTWLDPDCDTWTPSLTKLVEPKKRSLQCYPVPKEVGKVGNQSPTFVEPVSERKDGIEALFTKQSSTSKTKRKKSKSPETPSKKTKIEEDVDDDEIQFLGTTLKNEEAETLSKPPLPSQQSLSKKKLKPKDSPKKPSVTTGNKITAFFQPTANATAGAKKLSSQKKADREPT